MASMKSDLFDVEVKLHKKTAAAYLVSPDGDRRNAVWVPMSQCELEDPTEGKASILTLPNWLAEEKRLA